MNYVNQVCCSNWTQTNAKSRFEGFISKYKEAKRTSGQTGWGLNEDDLARNINTIEEKTHLLNTIDPPFIILKPSLHGGLSGCREWISLAEERSID